VDLVRQGRWRDAPLLLLKAVPFYLKTLAT
jgi:hypothetical protein